MAALSMKAEPDTPLPPTTSRGWCARHLSALAQRSSGTVLASCASLRAALQQRRISGEPEAPLWRRQPGARDLCGARKDHAEIGHVAAQEGRLHIDARAGFAREHRLQVLPPLVGHHHVANRQAWVHAAAMPENTMVLMLKLSRVRCVLIAALTMLMPLSSNTTSWPCNSPVVKRWPWMSVVWGDFRLASRSFSSGSKAERMAMRGVPSGPLRHWRPKQTRMRATVQQQPPGRGSESKWKRRACA